MLALHVNLSRLFVVTCSSGIDDLDLESRLAALRSG